MSSATVRSRRSTLPAFVQPFAWILASPDAKRLSERAWAIRGDYQGPAWFRRKSEDTEIFSPNALVSAVQAARARTERGRTPPG